MRFWGSWIQDITAAAKSLQSRPTLCDPIDGSPPGSPVPGILQARTLEWVALSFSNAWKWKVKVKSLSRIQLFTTPWIAAHQAPPSMGVPRQEYWSGSPKQPQNWNTSNIHSLLLLDFLSGTGVGSKGSKIGWPGRTFTSCIQQSTAHALPGPIRLTSASLVLFEWSHGGRRGTLSFFWGEPIWFHWGRIFSKWARICWKSFLGL